MAEENKTTGPVKEPGVMTMEQYFALPPEQQQREEAVLFRLASQAGGQNKGAIHQRPTNER